MKVHWERLCRWVIVCLALAAIPGQSDAQWWAGRMWAGHQEESGEEMMAREQYYYMRRAGGPGKTIPNDAFADAVKQYLALPRDKDNFNSPAAGTSWQTANPSGMFYAVTNANYISGRTNSFAFHPTDPNTFYIAAAGGGVWKTTNGGTNWTVLTDGLPSLTSGSVAVDPNNGSVVYYGTGELNYSLDSYYGNGIYKSTNAGSTWSQVATTGTVGSYISQIAVDPGNSNVVYASGSNGVYKSTNAGGNWSSTGSGTNASCIIIDPTNTQILFTSVGAGYSTNTGKQSTNGGTSWNNLAGGFPTTAYRIQLAMAPSNHLVVYASATNTSYGLLGLYRTTDGGTTWTLQASSPNYLGGQGWYDNSVCVKSTDPTYVVAGGLDIYASSNSGVTLTQKTNWATGTSSNMSHADIHFLGYNGSVLYCGSDGGVYKSTDDGTTWTDMNQTISTLQYQSADVDPTNTQKMYGGCQDNNLQTTSNGGTQWIQRTTGDGGYSVVDPVNTNYVYGQYVNGSLKRSANSGVSFSEIGPSGSSGGLFYNPYEMAPGDHNTVVYGRADVWKTTAVQSATTSSGWTQIASTGTVSGSVSAIGISSTSTNTIYIGTNGGRILTTTNNGTNWTTTTGYNYVSDFVVDPGNDAVAYASFTGSNSTMHLYKTTNTGTSWFSVTGDLPNIPTNTVVLDTAAPRTLYVGTDLGIYKSTNDGTNWVSFNSGLPPATVYDMKWKQGIRLLLCATHGRGVWTFDLSNPTPIQLSSFSATPAGSGLVQVRWETISEINNYGFEVQKSLNDQSQYQSIPNSFQPGHGTTNLPQRYAFDDASAQPGRWYYRLKQTDLNGAVHYLDGVQVEIVTGVAGTSRPLTFGLAQNYPNPFNPVTTIQYQLAATSHVTLAVTDILGKEVATLVNAVEEPGYKSVRFDASRLASGVYFYRLHAGTFDEVKRLVVMK